MSKNVTSMCVTIKNEDIPSLAKDINKLLKEHPYASFGVRRGEITDVGDFLTDQMYELKTNMNDDIIIVGCNVSIGIVDEEMFSIFTRYAQDNNFIEFTGGDKLIERYVYKNKQKVHITPQVIWDPPETSSEPDIIKPAER